MKSWLAPAARCTSADYYMVVDCTPVAHHMVVAGSTSAVRYMVVVRCISADYYTAVADYPPVHHCMTVAVRCTIAVRHTVVAGCMSAVRCTSAVRERMAAGIVSAVRCRAPAHHTMDPASRRPDRCHIDLMHVRMLYNS